MPTPKISDIADELTAIADKAASSMLMFADAAASVKPTPTKWSKKEILGHLMDSASNNLQRFIRAQMAETLVFPGYEQDEWVRRQDFNAKSWNELIELWKLYNRHVAHIMHNIPETKLSMTCTIGSGNPVTLGYIIEDYVAHLKHHLKQIGMADV